MFATLASLAWSQHGAFSTTQAQAAGVSRATLSRHKAAGEIIRRAPRVYTLACAPVTARQTTMVHILAAGPGAHATADSALGLWCHELRLPRRPVILVPRAAGYRTREARLIRSSDVELANPGLEDGIPVVSVARAILDAAATHTVDELLGVIGACQRHLPLAIGALTDVLHTHQRRGRPGISTFREALARLTVEIPDSEFERLVIRDLVRAGVPEPRLHHVVRLPGEEAIELDLDWPGVLLDVELDGRDHMARARTARRDRKRDRLLLAAGYAVPRYTWADYLDDGPGMIAEIASFVSHHPRGSGPT